MKMRKQSNPVFSLRMRQALGGRVGFLCEVPIFSSQGATQISQAHHLTVLKDQIQVQG
jgi:hypothetical protein